MKFQMQLLGSSLQPEEIKGDMGQWISGSFFFFFPPPNFQDTSVEKHALAQLCEALSLQLGTCTMPCMQSS